VPRVIDQKRYSILIADDHNLVRDAVAETLVAEGGFSATCVGDLPSALVALQGTEPFDLLLLDVFMPGMAGIGSIQQLSLIHI
jgi:CheY-like chemotaxis protein